MTKIKITFEQRRLHWIQMSKSVEQKNEQVYDKDDPRVAEAGRLKSEGYTNKRIAEELECSPSTVSRLLRCL